MSLLDTLKELFNPVQMQALPISFDIKSDSPASFKRNIGRIITLYQAISQGDLRIEVKHELEARLSACEKFGHTPPENIKEAQLIFTRIA